MAERAKIPLLWAFDLKHDDYVKFNAIFAALINLLHEKINIYTGCVLHTWQRVG